MDYGEETSIVEVEVGPKGTQSLDGLGEIHLVKELEPCLTSAESAVSTSIKADNDSCGRF